MNAIHTREPQTGRRAHPQYRLTAGYWIGGIVRLDDDLGAQHGEIEAVIQRGNRPHGKEGASD